METNSPVGLENARNQKNTILQSFSLKKIFFLLLILLILLTSILLFFIGSSGSRKAEVDNKITNENLVNNPQNLQGEIGNKLIFNKKEILVTNECTFGGGSPDICKIYAQNLEDEETRSLIDTFDYTKGEPAGNYGGLELEGNIQNYVIYRETYYDKDASDGEPVYKNTLGFVDLLTNKRTLLEKLTRSSYSTKEEEVGGRGVIIQVIPIKERNSVVYSISKNEEYFIKEYSFDTRKSKIVIDSKDLEPEANFYNDLPEPDQNQDSSRQRVVYLLPPPVVMQQLGKDIIVLKLATGGIGKIKRIDLASGNFFDYSFIPNTINEIVSNGDRIAYTYFNSAGYEVLETVDAESNKRVVLFKISAIESQDRIKFGFVANTIFFQVDSGRLKAWDGILYTSVKDLTDDPLFGLFDSESENYKRYNNYSDNLVLLSEETYDGSDWDVLNYLGRIVYDLRNKTFSIETEREFSMDAVEYMLVVMR